MLRWMAEITYLTGREQKTVAFEELEELHDIVEQGPDWNEIDRIVVTLNQPTPTPAKFTVLDGDKEKS